MTSSNVTNLNRFRKQKRREENRARADVNAVKFGRSKVEKERDTAKAKKADAALDGHKREDET